MELYDSSKQYMFNLHVSSSSEAKRLWKKSIKEKWKNQCAYCGTNEKLTIDHIVPRSRGGLDESKNVLCSCEQCNHSKGFSDWDDWYKSQYFFEESRYKKIKEWMHSDNKHEEKITKNLYVYGTRRNNAS